MWVSRRCGLTARKKCIILGRAPGLLLNYVLASELTSCAVMVHVREGLSVAGVLASVCTPILQPEMDNDERVVWIGSLDLCRYVDFLVCGTV